MKTNDVTCINATSAPCSGGHFFMFAGDPGPRLPEGWPCECGEVKYSHREAIEGQIAVLQKELEQLTKIVELI